MCDTPEGARRALHKRASGNAADFGQRMKEENHMMQQTQWNGFEGRLWREEINVRDFIQHNYTPYEGGRLFPGGAGRLHPASLG